MRVGNNSRSWFFSAVSSPDEQWGGSEARLIRLRWPGRIHTDWISLDFPRRCSHCALLSCLMGQGSLSSRPCFSCTRWLFSLLKCTYLRRWKDCRWVFWLFVCLCVPFSFFCCSFPGHALWMQQFSLSSPLARIGTSLLFLRFSYKVVYNGKWPSGILEPSLCIHFSKVRFCLFIFIALLCVLPKPIICAS